MLSNSVKWFGAVALVLALLPGCGGQVSETGFTYPYPAVATVGMIGDVVERIAGEQAEVEVLIGEGVDPHLYKPTRNDIVALELSRIVFYNGLSLEGKMGDVLVRIANDGRRVHAVTEAILAQGDYVLTDEEQHYDPHVWMDVGGWIRAAEVVRDALVDFDPNHAEDYTSNAAELLTEMEQLDAYAKSVLGSIPESRRILVTAHDAFNYPCTPITSMP